MNTFVFDIETIPDLDGARRVYGWDGLSDADVEQALFFQRRQQTGGSDFVRLHLQRIVCISAVLRTRDKLNVWSLGTAQSSEADLIQRFFDGIARYTPTLVSWNGSGFDLPVLHYRTLMHGIDASKYWDVGDDDKDFRWNNYISRFHWRHIDLMDVLAGYQARAVAPLDEIAALLGLPGKMGASGGGVWDQFKAGDIEGIRNYCETDVLNTYLAYLRFEKMRGRLSAEQHAAECEIVAEFLQKHDKAHFKQFFEIWQQRKSALAPAN